MEISGTVILKKGREGSIRRFHPWIFSGAIQSIDENVVDGNWVKVQDSFGNVLGFGHYQKGTITVRVASFTERRLRRISGKRKFWRRTASGFQRV